MENEKPGFKKIISQIILNFKYLSFFFFPRILFRRNLIRFVAPRQETRNTVEVKCTYSQRVKGINELSTGKEKKVSLFCQVKQYLIFLELQTVPLKKVIAIMQSYVIIPTLMNLTLLKFLKEYIIFV